MSSSDEFMDDMNGNGDLYGTVNRRFKDRAEQVAKTKEILSKQAVQTKEMLSKQAVKIAKQAEEHERFINKDFCYYANTIFLVDLLLYPKNEKLFMICFSFAEGPLAWALIVWRCSLVFSSMDKIISVLIHLLPGPQDIPYVYCVFYVTFVPLRWIYYRFKKWHYYLLDSSLGGSWVWRVLLSIGSIVFFTIRWWNPATFEAMHPEGTPHRFSWPYVEDKSYLWTWLFGVPLAAYTLWQVLYFLIVNVLRRQRLLRDPEVMTSYRELSKKAQKANNIWWRLSGLLGDQNRLLMYILLQAVFTVATMALTVPIFLSYEFHAIFQILKVSASVWNGGSFLLEVMPRQVIVKEKKKSGNQVPCQQEDQHSDLTENAMQANGSSVTHQSE
ncbi:hypothetical protein GOBAR_AA02780 [Gossypium barbadense]|uniref:Glycerophosphocholine acyltransferase 1 n=1 Tax=Gossypium barbadense TaxID=3634 RepID=A0A2P5YQ74_GOSBA|nr:hypothetical protein GOBAR_AA02780 [Gossypium barbadense]